jgi:hypothetical protein
MHLSEYEKSFLRSIVRGAPKGLVWIVGMLLAAWLVGFAFSRLTLSEFFGLALSIISAVLSRLFGLFTPFEWCVLILLCLLLARVSALHDSLKAVRDQMRSLAAVLGRE